MKSSCHENTFSIIGPLWRESMRHWWSSLAKGCCSGTLIPSVLIVCQCRLMCIQLSCLWFGTRWRPYGVTIMKALSNHMFVTLSGNIYEEYPNMTRHIFNHLHIRNKRVISITSWRARAIHSLQRRHNGRDSVSNQPFIETQIKENIKAPRHWPLWREFTGDRWIPRTNGQ